MAVIGKTKALTNLTREIRAIKGRTEKGMLTAGHFIRKKSQDKTPIDTGDLINSTYVQPVGFGNTPIIEIGYKQWYAVYVHEMLEYRHDNGQAKFLEAARDEFSNTALSIIAANARIKR